MREIAKFINKAYRQYSIYQDYWEIRRIIKYD